ncbi:hypothetical protein AAG906_007410 [Vitis piasezkii]
MAAILMSVAATVAGYLLDPIVRPLGYLFNHRSNLDELEEQVERLGNARARLQQYVDEANRQGDEIQSDVNKWLESTEKIIETAKKLIEDENGENTSCLCFNLKLRYQRSRQAKKQSGDIEEEESGRAARLSKSLQKQKSVLVILDDIWEELRLEKIGIPYGDAHRGCKVLLTSRRQNVFTRMGTQINFHVQHLCEEEAWSLFKKTTVAKALKGQSEAVWNNALQELKNSAPANIEGVHDKVYNCLQWSYDHLKSEEVKRLFLLCGMLGYGDISMDQLCVFGYNDENMVVKMHDVVGDVARAIAAKDPHWFVVIKDALGLEECQRKEEFRNCSRISLQCRDLRELPERLVLSWRTLNIFYELNTQGFLKLKHLHIICCPGIQCIVDSTKGVPSHSALPILEELNISGLDMDAVCYGPIPEGSFGKLRSLTVDDCKRLDGSVLREMGSLDSTRDFSSTGSSATQELSRSDVPTPFFNEQTPSLESLSMFNVNNVIAMWHNQLPLESCCKLKILKISVCNKFLNFVEICDCDSIKEIFDLGGVNCKEIHDITTIPLTQLSLDRLNSLKSVWNKDPQGLVSFQNQWSLHIFDCPCLKCLFPITIAKGLVRLNVLGIRKCGVEEIVANENGDETMSSLFPKLTMATFERANYVEMRSSGDTFQEIDSKGYIDSPIQQPFFDISLILFVWLSDAFPNLEQLILKGSKMKIWQGQFSGESFCKLRLLKIRKCHDILVVIPSNVLSKLHNLEELHVSKCNLVKEVFELVDKEYQVETLPRLTKMFLEDLPLLTYLFGLGQIFKNLHSVEVHGCGNLIYLVTSSMAKTLVQLKRGEEPYDIVFSKLQRLRLVNLQSLKCFFTRYIFTFPSLEKLKYTKAKGSKIDDHMEEHLGCDLNTIIRNIALEKVTFEKDLEALGATKSITFEGKSFSKFQNSLIFDDYALWDYGDSDDNDDDDEVNEEEDVMREMGRNLRMNKKMRMMMDHNHDD